MSKISYPEEMGRDGINKNEGVVEKIPNTSGIVASYLRTTIIAEN